MKSSRPSFSQKTRTETSSYRSGSQQAIEHRSNLFANTRGKYLGPVSAYATSTGASDSVGLPTDGMMRGWRVRSSTRNQVGPTLKPAYGNVTKRIEESAAGAGGS